MLDCTYNLRKQFNYVTCDRYCIYKMFSCAILSFYISALSYKLNFAVIMFHYVMLCNVMLCYVTLRYATLRYVQLRCVTLLYVAFYNVMFRYVMSCYGNAMKNFET